ncbi:unnamed protein product [Cylindrotheca closterium]|uniref:DDE Tnp4 domain-containing protein n=1 Tax=Cylindrotheca closterium TaxID=2856 RepID=A0AAD2D1G5_9STRA|nr:unnamed protein product [Cylindrotheca closterium]
MFSDSLQKPTHRNPPNKRTKQTFVRLSDRTCQTASIKEFPMNGLQESNFNTRYYSHKYNKAGLDYELGISLVDNRLLWIRGPFPAGTNELTVLREQGLLAELKRRKQSAIGDKGYNGEPNHVSTYNSHDNAGVKLFKSRALKRHENFNNLLKQNNILDTRFRHNETRFRDAFEACCVLAQYRIQGEIPLYEILIEDVVDRYNEDRQEF